MVDQLTTETATEYTLEHVQCQVYGVREFSDDQGDYVEVFFEKLDACYGTYDGCMTVWINEGGQLYGEW